jgi:hypothetical protein
MMNVLAVVLALLIVAAAAVEPTGAAIAATVVGSDEQVQKNTTSIVKSNTLIRREIQFCAGRNQACGSNNIQCCGSDQCVVNVCKSSTCGGNVNTPCVRTDDCCPPLHCRQNVCNVVTPVCSSANGVCYTQADCCPNQNLQCNLSTNRCGSVGTSSCGLLGGFCYSSSDCCAGFACRGGLCGYAANPNACRPIYQACVRTSDCCSTLHCRQNVCDRSQCGVQGQVCRQSSDCCVGGVCGTNGACLFAVPYVGNDPPATIGANCVAEINAACSDPDMPCCSGNVCSGGRCAPSTSSSGGTQPSCTNTVGAACQTDDDCCGPNFNCDIHGKYCTHG